MLIIRGGVDGWRAESAPAATRTRGKTVNTWQSLRATRAAPRAKLKQGRPMSRRAAHTATQLLACAVLAHQFLAVAAAEHPLTSRASWHGKSRGGDYGRAERHHDRHAVVDVDVGTQACASVLRDLPELSPALRAHLIGMAFAGHRHRCVTFPVHL